MKFSVSTLAFPGYGAEEAIRASASIGFDGVDIRVRQDGHIRIDSTKEERKRLLDLAKSLSIDFYGVYSYVGSGMVSPDPAVRMKEVDLLKAHLDMALDLGANHVRIFSGTKERTPENMMRFIETCKLACKAAQDRGIYIGLETHGELAWDGDSCLYMINNIGSESVRIIFDPAHLFRFGLNPIIEGEKMREHILSIQFKDFFIGEGDRNRYVLLGQGEVPNEEFIDFIRKTKFDGFIVEEYEKWWHPELPDPMQGLRHDLNYLKKKLLK